MPSQQLTWKNFQYPESTKLIHRYHSDIRDLSEDITQEFMDHEKIYKQHISPTKNHLKLLRDCKKVILLREPEEIIAAYYRADRKKLHKPRPEFQDCKTIEDWKNRAHQNGLLEDLNWFYSQWLKESCNYPENNLVINYSELINDPKQAINKIEVFYNLPISKNVKLEKERYSRIKLPLPTNKKILIMKNKIKILIKKTVNLLGLEISISKKKNSSAKSIWQGRKLEWKDNGYWLVTPMPTQKELNEYYSSTYWQSRGGKKCLVQPRDLNHFLEIQELYPKKTFSKVLNFGAGHGGISILFYMQGAEVANIEPSGLDLGLDWKTFQRIEEVTGSYDLIYGSHSLEHVTDIDSFFNYAEKLLNPSGIFYFEVPNCHPDNPKSYPNGKIHIPHTYYFTRDFFSRLPYHINLNSTYSSINKATYTKLNDDTGSVIRFSSEKLKS